MFRLLKLIKGYWFLFIGVVLLMIIHQFTYSYIPFFTQHVFKILEYKSTQVESGLPKFLLNLFQSINNNLEAILLVASFLVLFQVFRFLMRFIEMRLSGNLRESITNNLKIHLFGHIQDLPYKFHGESESGDLIQRVTSDVETVSFFISRQLLDFLFIIMTLSFGSYQLMKINSKIVWITLMMVPFVGVASFFYSRKINQRYQKIEESESDMMTTIQENLSSNKVVRAFGNEKFELEKLDRKNKEYLKDMKKANSLSSTYWGIMDMIASIQYLVVIIVGVWSVREGNMDASDIIAALGLVGMLIWPIRRIGRIVNNFGRALVSAARIEDLLEIEDEYVSDGILEPEISGKIEFKNVYFKYDKQYILENASFVIPAGSKAAFIGKTGSGKSTIIYLLLRLYEPDEGEILIDDIPIKEISKKYLRKQLGVVLQEPFLYAKTVYDNIAIADPFASEEVVKRAALISTIDEDIANFKDGYNTLIGEKGTTLSGGQRQRVAISRVLIGDKKILLFDDALSAVDTNTEADIREALSSSKNKTTITITHRILTAKSQDIIFILENGIITNQGTHDELIKIEGLYKTIWDIQGSLEKEFIEMIEGRHYEP